MSPIRAGSSHSSSWRIFSSARLGSWPFSLQLEIENRPQTSRNLIFCWRSIFLLIFIINLYWKWLNYAAKSNYSTLKTPFVLINSDKWSWNWLESCYWSKIGNLIVVKKICEFLTSKIPVLRIHTIKTPLIVQIYIITFFSGSQKPYY